MREEIKLGFSISFDVPAELPLAEQAESARSFLDDVLCNAFPGDTATGPGTLYSLGKVELTDAQSESQIYSGEARNAFTRPGFKAFTVARCREQTDLAGDSFVERCGWTPPRPRALAGPAFWTVYGFRVGEGSQAVGDFKSRASALCMADALADGRAVDCDDSALPPFRVTWEIVTDESAEHGDADARGFVRYDGAREPLERDRLDPNGDIYNMRLRDALEALESSAGDLESLEPSDSYHSAARWITAHYNTRNADAGDVIGESLSLHLPESITPASRTRLVRLICKN